MVCVCVCVRFSVCVASCHEYLSEFCGRFGGNRLALWRKRVDVSGNKRNKAELNGFSGALCLLYFPTQNRKTNGDDDDGTIRFSRAAPEVSRPHFSPVPEWSVAGNGPGLDIGIASRAYLLFSEKGTFPCRRVMKCGCVRSPRWGKHYCENILRGRKLSRKWFVLANVCRFELNGNSLWLFNWVQ